MKVPSKNTCAGIGGLLFGTGWAVNLLLIDADLSNVIWIIIAILLGSGLLLTCYGFWPKGQFLRGLRNTAVITVIAVALLIVVVGVGLGHSLSGS